MQQPTVSIDELSYAAQTLRRYSSGEELRDMEHARLHDIAYRLFSLNATRVRPAIDGPGRKYVVTAPREVAHSLMHYNQPRDLLHKELLDLPTLEKELEGLAGVVTGQKH